jgi:hypothetical protein
MSTSRKLILNTRELHCQCVCDELPTPMIASGIFMDSSPNTVGLFKATNNEPVAPERHEARSAYKTLEKVKQKQCGVGGPGS